MTDIQALDNKKFTKVHQMAYELLKMRYGETDPDKARFTADLIVSAYLETSRPESSGIWIPKEDFRGEPNSCPLGWWAGRRDESEPYLDEILLDEQGRICGKGGCGADYYTHVMIAGFERPKFPSNSTDGK